MNNEMNFDCIFSIMHKSRAHHLRVASVAAKDIWRFYASIWM